MQGAPPRLNHSIVRAGAGAGKTWGLVEKVVEVFRTFAAAGARPRVVVTTFTRKATQELKERLILKACELRDPRLLQFVSDPSSLQITTIHGLLNGFMRQVGHLAGLDAGFQIVGEAEASRQARLALRETLVEHPEGLTWLETYGFARALAMCRGYERAVREQGELSPAGIEELRALAEEERRRWSGVLKNLALSVREEVDDDKWRDFAAALLRFSSVWKGEGLDGVDLPWKPRNSKKQAHLQVWHERTEELLKDFKKEMAKPCWNQALWEDMVLAWEEFLPLGQAFAEKLKALKDREGRFEMVDLELKSLEMLREKPFLGSVFAENWDFWMIDEYQDTSPLQVAVLSALIGDRPKYVVGDPQQSIYLFRGAEVRVFDQAEREILSGGGEKRELLKNYRSRPDLLLWINDFMASIGEDFVAMDPRDPPAAPQRECARLVRARDPENELNAITAEVARHVNAGARLEQICVLGRTHRALMDVSKALRTAGYATHVHAARGFLERREVIDAQALWKFLVNPHDNLNLMILLRSPWFFVKDQTLGEWMERKPDSLWRRLMVVEDHESVSRLRKALQLVNARGVATAFEETLIEAAYLDLSLANDPAGRKESNLWKLIHRARRLEREQGVSVLDFLEGASDPMESSEGDATSAQEPNAINLMTIHGAKGLQFEHVIVPRMGESPRTSNAEPFAAQDGRYFFSLKDEETGEFVPSPLENVRVRDQRARELAEFDRWLYVAVTRAKSTLFLSWSEVGRESWAARGRWFALPAQRHSREHYCFDIL
ncbi:MAG TPA: UvrD-helicase domain-containing protein, partial [Bdellovibrionales bacterium]|nr:UvrD-helicase domain-containing protein [Bdellovibrionales bacterium]